MTRFFLPPCMPVPSLKAFSQRADALAGERGRPDVCWAVELPIQSRKRMFHRGWRSIMV